MIITTCKHFVTNSVLNYQKNIKSSLERSKNDTATRYEGALAVELEVEDPENLPRYTAEAYTYLRDLVLEVTGVHPE